MLNTLRFCSVETEDNFIFCNHSSRKEYVMEIKLVFTDNKDSEGNKIVTEVDYCPFCGFTYKTEDSKP